MKRVMSIVMAACLLIGILGGCKKTTIKSGESAGSGDASYSGASGQTSGDTSSGTSASDASDVTSGGATATAQGSTGGSTGGVTGGITDNITGGKKTYYTNDLGAKSSSTIVNNCYKSGYPIAKKTITFNIMIKDYSNQANYAAMKINEFIKNKMNIKINWTIVEPSDVGSRQTLAYASGNLPDIFMGMAPSSMSWQYTFAKQGLIKQMDSYINDYAPNMRQLFNVVPKLKYSVTAQDGHIYSLPMLNSDRDPFIYEGLYINKKWLSNLKLAMPTNTTQLAKVLTAFLNNDPNGNGKKDEIPLCLHYDNMAGILPACLYGPFGLAVYGGYAGYMVNDSGKIQANYLSKNYKTALTYYRMLYKRGLIDRDWLTNSAAAVKNKLNTSVATVGAFVSGAPLTLMSADRFSQYTLVPAFKDASVSKGTWSITANEFVWPEWFIMTKSCKYPEAAVRMADYFYSLEGTLTALQGPQGYNWNVRNDGSIYMTDAYYKGSNNLANLTPGYPMPNFAGPAYQTLTDVTASNLTSKENRIAAQAEKDIRAAYGSVAPKNIYPNLVDFQSDKIAGKKVQDQLVPYVQSLAQQFVSGSTDIGAFWDNYINVCKSLGCENDVYYQQVAYNRYVKAK